MSKYNPNARIIPYFANGRYYNYQGEKRPPVLIPSIKMLLQTQFERINRSGTKTDYNNWFEPVNAVARSQELVITWIGHATFLIQIDGINILTDPVFGNLSPLYPRIIPAGIDLLNLPPIDFVLLSHNHRDHMDSVTLNILKKHQNITFLVPKGDKAWFSNRGFTNVIESTWWDRHNFYNFEFTFLPAYHWSQRGLFDYNKSLWGSWMITINKSGSRAVLTSQNIYFAGDTAIWDHFKSISEAFKQIDVALMPIGPCEPRSVMSKSHLSAEEAVEAFITLNARHFIPMHWGTYFFGLDKFLLPYERLIASWNKLESTTQNLQDKYLNIFKIGQRRIFESSQAVDLTSRKQTSNSPNIQI